MTILPAMAVPDLWATIAARKQLREEYGVDIRTIQELLGHNDVSTTVSYAHVLRRGPCGVRSPADRLPEWSVVGAVQGATTVPVATQVR